MIYIIVSAFLYTRNNQKTIFKRYLYQMKKEVKEKKQERKGRRPNNKSNKSRASP